LRRHGALYRIGTGEAINEYVSDGIVPAYETRRAQMIEAIEVIAADLWWAKA